MRAGIGLALAMLAAPVMAQDEAGDADGIRADGTVIVQSFELPPSRYMSEEAGVEAELLVWDGLTHAFFYDPRLPESGEAFAAQARFLAEHLGLQLPQGQ